MFAKIKSLFTRKPRISPADTTPAFKPVDVTEFHISHPVHHRRHPMSTYGFTPNNF